MAVRTKGFCKFCGKEYTKAGMVKHLRTCKERELYNKNISKAKKSGGYELVITDRYNSDYWLIIAMRESAKLVELDQFIRDIWVECCGHLSCFTINGVVYEEEPEEDLWGNESESMDIRLDEVLSVGMKFLYEYDFGSTTELIVQVADYMNEYMEKDNITILSRNHPPHILCNMCGENEADWIDIMKLYDLEGDAYLCEECIKKLESSGDDCEMYMPVCNSPRMGVCGYRGSSKFPEQFIPSCCDK